MYAANGQPINAGDAPCVFTKLSGRNAGQCKCLWCGQHRHHCRPCRMPTHLRLALRTYAAAHGRTWRSQLLEQWRRGEESDLQLRRIRNLLGPSGLQRIPTWLIRRHA